MKVGIPRGLHFHKYKILWTAFLDYLEVDYIVSTKTNKQILNRGKKYSTDETCIPCKIYLGHIDYLKDKCDYILVPRFLGEDKLKLECIKFNSIYDVVSNTFPNIKLLEYNIDYTKRKKEKDEFIKLGSMLGYKAKDSLQAYYYAKSEEEKYTKNMFKKQELKLKIINKKKVLILSHPYNIFDNMIGKPIIDILNRYNVEVIYSTYYNSNKDNSKKYSETLYWLSSKDIINALDYYKNRVDGIIILNAFPCGNDALVNVLITNKVDIPIVNIVVDEVNSETGLITRLESFIDIIEKRSELLEESY